VVIAMGSSSRGSNIVIVPVIVQVMAWPVALTFFSTSKPLKKRALFFRLAL